LGVGEEGAKKEEGEIIRRQGASNLLFWGDHAGAKSDEKK